MKHYSLLLTTLGILFFFAATANAEVSGRCQKSGVYFLFDVDADGKTDAFTDGAALMAWAQGKPVFAYQRAPFNRLNPYEYIQGDVTRIDIDGDGAFKTYDAEIIFGYLAGASDRALEDHCSPKRRCNGRIMRQLLDVYSRSITYCMPHQ